MKALIQQVRSGGFHQLSTLLAALALSLAGALPLPTFAAEAGNIDSIAPACATVGDRVTITGIGFGAHNVSIAADDIPAQVVAATGNSATFIVPCYAHQRSAAWCPGPAPVQLYTRRTRWHQYH